MASVVPIPGIYVKVISSPFSTESKAARSLSIFSLQRLLRVRRVVGEGLDVGVHHLLSAHRSKEVQKIPFAEPWKHYSSYHFCNQ